MIRVGRTRTVGLTVYLTEQDANRLGGLRTSVALSIHRLEDGSIMLRIERGDGCRILQNQKNMLYPFRMQCAKLRQMEGHDIVKLDGAVARVEDLPYRERLKAAVLAMNEVIESAPENVVIEVHDVALFEGDGSSYARVKKQSRVKARIVITEEF
jgi:putative component of toxin-antitoxin plasmid stabilization module